MKIKVALFGLGRSGKVVAESLREDKRFELVFAIKNKVEKTDEFDFLIEPSEQIDTLINKFKPDIVLDFSTANAVISNIEKLKEGMGYVIATTGFSENELQRIKETKHLKIIYAANISDGINVFIRLCELLNKIWDTADTEIIEQHFKEKKDMPSGTAQELAKVFKQEVPIHSVRAGGITGVHEVIFATNNQKITIKHESFSKEVFAESAKKAALWLTNMPCGFYEISEVYNQT